MLAQVHVHVCVCVINVCVGIMVTSVFNSIGEVDNAALIGVEVTGVDVIVDVAKDDTVLENVIVNGDIGVEIVAVKDDTAALKSVIVTVKSDIGEDDMGFAVDDGIVVEKTVGKEDTIL